MEDIKPAGVETETGAAGKAASAATPLMPGWWGVLPDFLLSIYIFRIWLEPWRYSAKEISGVLKFLGVDLLMAVSMILIGTALIKKDSLRIAGYGLLILMFFGPAFSGAGLIPFAGFVLLMGTRFLVIYNAGGTERQLDFHYMVDILVPFFLVFASFYILIGAFEVERIGDSLSDRDVAAGVMIYFWLRGLAGLCAVYAEGVRARRLGSGEKFYFTGNWR